MNLQDHAIKVDIIAAGVFSKKHGKMIIGDHDNNNIPWDLPEDIKYFMKKTHKKICIMGRKTLESLPGGPLKNRLNVVLTKAKNNENLSKYDNVVYVRSIQELFTFIKIAKYDSVYSGVFDTVSNPVVIGGSMVYSYFMNEEYSDLFLSENVMITEIKSQKIQSQVSKISNPVLLDIGLLCHSKYSIKSHTYSLADKGIVYIVFSRNTQESLVKKYDTIYKDLCENIVENGEIREDRTKTGTVSLFGQSLHIDVSENCPILTTKWVAWKTCVKELLWFLKGQTDSKILESQGVNIWKGNTSREFLDSRGLMDYQEGELGPGYGWQIRRSGADFPCKDNGVDQLKYIEDLLEKDPFSRRIMWNLWIPKDLERMALTPCHCQIQLYVYKNKTMDISVYIRSNDIFLGNPFNVFSYYVLLKLLCIRHDMKPGKIILNLGDSHIYTNHIEQVKEQITRSPRISPRLVINPSVRDKSWEEITIEDFDLIGYFPDKTIHGKMAV